jgi:hypothetical protein
MWNFGIGPPRYWLFSKIQYGLYLPNTAGMFDIKLSQKFPAIIS